MKEKAPTPNIADNQERVGGRGKTSEKGFKRRAGKCLIARVKRVKDKTKKEDGGKHR